MHPDVYDAGAGNTLFGHRYWMAMTPYTNNDPTTENPSILVSEDGDTWVVPDGLTNPIIPYPGSNHNYDDVDLILGQDGKFYLYYCYNLSVSPWTGAIRVMSSVDGITWGTPTTLISGVDYIASPAVIWDGLQYVMFHMTAPDSPNNKLWRRTCATPNGTWSAATEITMDRPWDRDLWHLNVITDGSILWCIMTCSVAGQLPGASVLCLLKSTDDGLTWRYISYAPLLSPGAGAAWDNSKIYRSTAIRTVSGFDLWYSAENTSHVWHIARTTVLLS